MMFGLVFVIASALILPVTVIGVLLIWSWSPCDTTSTKKHQRQPRDLLATWEKQRDQDVLRSERNAQPRRFSGVRCSIGLAVTSSDSS
jgi:hypothetical protein